jgi:SNF2 family DNA or RNA helicase
VDNSKRQALLDEFNTGEKQILIMTSAGQYGLNIQSASVIIHYDLPWSISRTLQREGRAHRKGQTENVLVYSLLGRGTIDEYISKKLLKKKDISDRILIEDLVEMLEL